MDDLAPQSIRFDLVADLYDSYVDVQFDIPFWVQEAGRVRGKVLEAACGTGRVSIPLLNAGVELSCVDYSPCMLEQLRRKLEEHRLFCSIYCQDMAELALPERFDLIFIPFHSFSEILDEYRQKQALARLSAHLTPGGTFICTLQNPAVRTAGMDGMHRIIGKYPMCNGRTLVVRSALTYDPGSHLASGEQIYEISGWDKHVIERRCLDINFHLFDKEEFEFLLKGTGLETEALYGDYDRKAFDPAASPYMIWKLRRRARMAP